MKKQILIFGLILFAMIIISCNKDKDPITTTTQSTVTEHKYYRTYTPNSPCFLKDTITFYSSTEMYNPWVGQCLIDPRFTVTGTLNSSNRYEYSIDTAPGSQNISGVWDWGNATATMDNDVFVSVKLYNIPTSVTQYVHTGTYLKVQ